MTRSLWNSRAGKGSRKKPRAKPDSWNFTDGALDQFRRITQPVAHPAGAVVFKEGDPATGIFLVCTGQVKLFATAPGGQIMIPKIARPGDVLGLSAMLNDLPYEVTAETLLPCDFKYISQQLFLRFLEGFTEAGYMASLALAKEHRELFLGTRRLALSPSAAARIAQVLLGFVASEAAKEVIPSFPMVLTHAELASLAGTSRETVTRLLNMFERDGIISRDNSIITIAQLSQLEHLAH